MHCFFHLVNAADIIIDNVGINVADLVSAKRLALEAIQDLKREGIDTSSEWEGWSLTIADASGHILASISLTEDAKCHASARQRQFAS